MTYLSIDTASYPRRLEFISPSTI